MIQMVLTPMAMVGAVKAMEDNMSQAALFGFGSIIFFIVATGALLYGMATLDEFYNRDYDKELE